MADGKFIWVDAEGTGRNRWGLFRTTFELAGMPAGGHLSIFADTRYRLVVNGRVLGHGPARFFPAKPEYDTIELAPALRQGRNAIAIVVNSTGGVTFHSEPSVGGLIAWGEVRDDAGNVVAIATDESWRAMESPGHRPDTHYMSFALNPAEQLDAQKMPPGWERPDFDDSGWPHAVLHAHPDHWGPLRPRTIPLLDESAVQPVRRLGAWAAREFPNEDVHSLMVVARGGKSLHTNARVAVMAFIHSPREQETTFGAWWGKYWVNGEPVQATSRRDDHLRRDFPLRLREGWNTLLVVETVKHDWWDFYLALPREAGLELGAEREIGSPHTFLVGGLWEDALADEADRVAWPIAEPGDLPETLGPWKLWPRGKKADTPCRERAWMILEHLQEHGQTSLPVAPTGGAALALLYDFGGEVLGRPVLDFTAEAGTVVDLAYTERLKADGTADVHWRYFVDMMERYVARDGRQTWQTFHPRGCRYLEVLVKGDLAAFQLHGVSLTRAAYPVEPVGSFECSDPTLNRIWALGPPTLRACMEDAYLDCPWRERGLYTGDFFVEFYSNLAAFGDTALFRRCIELFFQSQGDNGLIRPCPHGLPPGRHPDYSAILAQCLWHYWARTGDLASSSAPSAMAPACSASSARRPSPSAGESEPTASPPPSATDSGARRTRHSPSTRPRPCPTQAHRPRPTLSPSSTTSPSATRCGPRSTGSSARCGGTCARRTRRARPCNSRAATRNPSSPSASRGPTATTRRREASAHQSRLCGTTRAGCGASPTSWPSRTRLGR